MKMCPVYGGNTKAAHDGDQGRGHLCHRGQERARVDPGSSGGQQ